MRPFQYSSIIFLILASVALYAANAGNASWWWLVAIVVLYLHLLVLGAIYIRWNFYLPSLHANPAKGKQIAITFDDGPGFFSNPILDVLKKENVQAAFFTIGKNVVADKETVLRMYNEGHIVGNHSYDHGFNFDWKTAKAMLQEIEETNAAIAAIIHKKPLLFRPPYGVTNPNLAKAVRLSGMQSIGWSLRSFDTAAKDAEKLSEKILNQLKDGDIILLHDSMSITHQILTNFIHTARKMGFTFVRPDQLLDIQAYA